MTEAFIQNKAATRKNFSLLASLAATLFFLAGSGYITYANILIIKQDAALVSHTHEVMIALDNLLLLMREAETAQRGYLLTGQENYLEPYDRAFGLASGQVERIKKLTEDNRQQQDYIPALNSSVLKV